MPASAADVPLLLLLLLLAGPVLCQRQGPGWCARHAAYMISGDGTSEWSWKPHNPCQYATASPSDMVRLLANTTIMFAGDSVSRYQWCALHGILTGGPYGCGAGVQTSLGNGTHLLLREVPEAGIRLLFTWMPSLEYMSLPQNLLFWLNITGLDAAVFNSGIHLWAEPFSADQRLRKATEWAQKMVTRSLERAQGCCFFGREASTSNNRRSPVLRCRLLYTCRRLPLNRRYLPFKCRPIVFFVVEAFAVWSQSHNPM